MNMQAIILAAGIGKRLQPLTHEIPKCLIQVGNFVILGRILDSLKANGICDIIITTGPFEEKIKGFVAQHYPALNTIYVKNDQYDKTNYIYSLWLARDYIKGDIILMHGDLVYDPLLMRRVVLNDETCVLVHKNVVSEKDFNARVENGRIREIGVKVFGESARFCVPLYKVLKDDWKEWMDEMGRFVERGEVTCYAENALNNITDRVKLAPLFFDEEFAMEVDDFDDLKKAESIVKNYYFV